MKWFVIGFSVLVVGVIVFIVADNVGVQEFSTTGTIVNIGYENGYYTYATTGNTSVPVWNPGHYDVTIQLNNENVVGEFEVIDGYNVNQTVNVTYHVGRFTGATYIDAMDNIQASD